MTEYVTIGLSVTASIMTISAEVSKLLNLGKNGRRPAEIVDFSGYISKYLQAEYKRVSKINSFAFEGKRDLDEMYIPSVISPYNDKEKVEIGNIISFKNIKREKIIIIDSAGMGKSTLSKFLFVKAVETEEYLPILIEARKLNGEISVERYIFEVIFDGIEYSQKVIEKMMLSQKILVIIDGLDEISIKYKNTVLGKIKSFIDRYNCRMVLTSRPDDTLEALQDVYKYHIHPLKKNDAYKLLRKIDVLGERSELLINKIEEDHNKDILHFLENPMMVSLLYRSFAYKNDIPAKKSVFYRQVYDALYSAHDLSKGDAYVREKNSGLDIEDFHRLTRILAFLTYKDSKLEFTRDEIVGYISSCRDFVSEFEFNPSSYLKDLFITVPIFIKEGDYFRWSHKSMQEYFASQFISIDAGESAKDIIKSMYNSKNYMYYDNLIDILYDTNYKMIEEYLLRDLFKEIVSYSDKFVSENTLKSIEKSLLIRRSMLMVMYDVVIMPFDPVKARQAPGEDGIPQYIDECFTQAGNLLDGNPRKSMYFSEDVVNVVVGVRDLRMKWMLDILKRKKSPCIKKFESSNVMFDRRVVSKAQVIEEGKKVYNSKKYYDLTTEMIARSNKYEIDFDKLKEIIEKLEFVTSRPSLLRMV